MSTPAKPSGTQAIDRALSVLLCFGSQRSELGITELSRSLGLTPSTVHRIVRALVDRGFLEQDPASERYRLGRAMTLLGQSALERFGLTGARRILERVGEATGESLNLGIRDRMAMLVLTRVTSQHALRFDHRPGQRVPLHATSMGKAVLAFGDDPAAAVAEVADATGLTRYTPTTLVTAEELTAELERTRARGYSIDDEESIAGVRCVGAPVLDPAGYARAAIAVQAPAVRMPSERVHDLGAMLTGAAAEIAIAMGFTGGAPDDGAAPDAVSDMPVDNGDQSRIV